MNLPRPAKASIVLLLLAGMLLLSLPGPGGAMATSPGLFYFFNPDSSQSNLSRLKQVMDSALSAEGLTLSFQPFARLRDFDSKMQGDPPGFLFLPEWYLRQDGNQARFKPFLAPMRQGVTTYRKALLVAADSAFTIRDIPSTTIAMTPMGPAGMAMLDQAVFRPHGLDGGKLKFLTTAKDSDALFALTLRQVSAALVSQDNLEQLGRINPNILATVKTLAVSDPIPLPVLCYAQGAVSAAEVERVKKIFLAGRQDKNTATIMEMLQIDAWQTIP
ncbi:MAG: PhnD/SsuA/transferrin family substrate-binding protein [Thermodesulfobacteriota bacterium]